jgi:hypothetical protein
VHWRVALSMTQILTQGVSMELRRMPVPVKGR